MSRDFHLLLTDQQHRWLTDESERTSVPASELVRRALERTYDIDGPRTTGLEVHVAIWRRRIFGRRAGVTFEPRWRAPRRRRGMSRR
jgi:hypothetical protein